MNSLSFLQIGISPHHFPIVDGSIPSIGNLLDVIKSIADYLLSGQKVLVHCFGGYGRAGEMLDVYV